MTALIRGLPPGVPRPAVNLSLMGGAVQVLGFGKPHNWSLAGYNDNAQGGTVPNEDIENYLPPIAACFGLGKILYAPSPHLFNAEVCSESEAMKKRYHVRSERYHDSVWLDRGKNADGLPLSPGHCYAVPPAGCPTIVIHDEGRPLGVIHAGMRSVINEGRLKRMLGIKGGAFRRRESVVHSLLKAMGVKTKRDAKRLEAAILFPIDPAVFTYPWDHKVFGALNRLRSEDTAERYGVESVPGFGDPVEERQGRIDLAAVIRAQLMGRGVPAERISVIPSPPRELWYDTRESEADAKKRNLVLVKYL